MNSYFNQDMNTFIRDLLRKGVRLGAEGNNLKIVSGASRLSDQDKQLIKSHKAALLDFLQGGKIAVLSFSQERLWFLAQLGYGFQYHLPLIGRIEGPLQADLLTKALNLLVGRHESFRTTFRVLDDLTFQHVCADLRIEIPMTDLTDHPDQDQLRKDTVQSVIEAPFDLERGPLIRAKLIRLSPHTHILAVCMHHIISDGWSVRIILRELREAYECLCRGSLPPWQPLQLSYSGYAIWQRDALAGEAIEKELTYWKKQLSNYQDLELPADFRRPDRPDGKGAMYSYRIDPATCEAIRQHSTRLRTTSLTYYLASVYILLSRYSNQDDICFGMPVAGRSGQELEDLVGFFVNTLIIRIQNQNKQVTTGQLLKQIHSIMVEAQDHQHLPVEKVLEAIQPERSLSRSPVFQTLISYAPAVIDQMSLGTCIVRPETFESSISKFDLSFSFTETSDGATDLVVEYATGLFLPWTIRQFCRQLHTIVQMLSRDLELPAASICLFSDEDQELMDRVNDTSVRFPEDLCVHQLFEHTASRCPEHIALIDEDLSMSYRELSQLSDQIAFVLQNTGVQPDEIVGICIPRSAAMIAGVLGILKSGGAYTPLDAQLPDERIRMILADSGVNKIIATASGLKRLRSLDPGTITLIDIDDKVVARSATWQKPAYIAGPGNLAYLLYTSGSSGSPKGVMIEHHSVVNHNLAAIEAYGMTRSDHVLQFSTISFDIFVEEVFPTLLAGATLVLMDEHRYADTDYFKALVYRQQVTLLNLPTAFWHMLAEEDFRKSAVRLVVIGGEKARTSLYNKWHRTNPHIPVINTYGPTEATVIALLHKLDGEIPEGYDLPIGRPIANTRILILDEHMQPCPAGMPGELYLSGQGLARGYRNLPEHTAKAFVSHPWEPGTLLYRTGDKVRLLADGTIGYLGRMDFQIKIRGFRVEPEEIEKILTGYSHVKEALVAARDHRHGKVLCAYVACENDHRERLLQELPGILRRKLPSYMIPSEWVVLEQFPLTINGKTDRKRLLATIPDASRAETYRAPRTETEKALAPIWAETLDKSTVGADDHFFDLGGHSLLLIQLVNTIQTRMNVQVRIADVMEHPTIRQLGYCLDSRREKSHSPCLIGFHTEISSVTEPVWQIIIPGMPGLCEGYYELADSLRTYGPVYGLQMKGYNNDRPATSVQEMAEHNLDLLQKLAPHGKLCLYAHSYGGTVVYEMLKQLQKSEKYRFVIERIVLIDSGPLLAMTATDTAFVQRISRDLIEMLNIPPDQGLSFLETLNSQTGTDWSKALLVFLKEHLKTSDTFLASIQQVMEASLTQSYTYGNIQLPYTVWHLISEESHSWLRPDGWNPCYRQVQVLYTGKTHLSIVRNPDCREWTRNVYLEKPASAILDI